MTLQQLKILLAVDQFGSITEAADSLGLSLSTLSSHIKNIEQELDKVIFDRSSKKITTTPFGRKYINKAKAIIKQTEELEELVNEESEETTGELNLCIGTTIAPYLVPGLIRVFGEKFPAVKLKIEESRIEPMLVAIKEHRFDVAIELSNLRNDDRYSASLRNDLLEIPLYREKYYMYGSSSCSCGRNGMSAKKVDYNNMYIMPASINSNACCIGNKENKGKYIFSSGSIDNLIRIVDQNKGYTIIPEMHLQFLTDIQRETNVSECDENHTPFRDISVYINSDYARESLINALIDAIKEIIPERMIDERLKKMRVKL